MIYVALAEGLEMTLKILLTGESRLHGEALIEQVQKRFGMKDLKVALQSPL